VIKFSALLADMELRVGNKYRLGRKIGSGSFGDIYLGLYLFDFHYFVKFETSNCHLLACINQMQLSDIKQCKMYTKKQYKTTETQKLTDAKRKDNI